MIFTFIQFPLSAVGVCASICLVFGVLFVVFLLRFLCVRSSVLVFLSTKYITPPTCCALCNIREAFQSQGKLKMECQYHRRTSQKSIFQVTFMTEDGVEKEPHSLISENVQCSAENAMSYCTMNPLNVRFPCTFYVFTIRNRVWLSFTAKVDAVICFSMR